MIIDSYDINSEPIVKLENFYGEKQHLVKKCMVIFSKVIYEYMLEKFPCRQIAEVRACNGNIPVWTLPYEEETIAFYLTPIGSALAAGMIAEVNHLTGASTFMRQSGQRSNRWKVYSPNGGIPGRRTVLLFCRTAGLHKNKKHGQTGGIFQREKSALCAGKSMDDRQYVSGNGKSCKQTKRRRMHCRGNGTRRRSGDQ